MCIPIDVWRAISSVVQPSSCKNADCPVINPRYGTVRHIKTPLLRVTGIISLSGLTAISAFTFGLNKPTSPRSSVARTAFISTSPIFEKASISPG